MTANDLRHDAPEPDPPTPEDRFHRECGNVDEWAVRECVTALRDMIASQDRELERQSAAINRLERRIEALERGKR